MSTRIIATGDLVDVVPCYDWRGHVRAALLAVGASGAAVLAWWWGPR